MRRGAADAVRTQLPRYVRVNTLLTTMDAAVRRFRLAGCAQYWNVHHGIALNKRKVTAHTCRFQLSAPGDRRTETECARPTTRWPVSIV